MGSCLCFFACFAVPSFRFLVLFIVFFGGTFIKKIYDYQAAPWSGHFTNEERNRGILLTKPHDLSFGGVQNKVKGRESLLDTKKALL